MPVAAMLPTVAGGAVGAGIAVAIAGDVATIAVGAIVAGTAFVAVATAGDGATVAVAVGDETASDVGVSAVIGSGWLAPVGAVGWTGVAVGTGSVPQAASRALLAASVAPPSAIRSSPLLPPGTRGFSSGTLNKPYASRIVGHSLH